MTEAIVGILGGMGPEATVDLMNRVIQATPALDDADHIRMIVDNNPKVPSRIKALIEGNGESPIPSLTEMAQRLECWGADFLVMPCNTAHYYHSSIAAAVSIPVVNLIDLAAEQITRQHSQIRKLGLLASTAVLKTKLYEQRFARNQIQTPFPKPSIQSSVMALIKGIKAKRYDAALLQQLDLAVADLHTQGAECLLIACTELSVVAANIHTKQPIYDAAQLLAEHIVQTVKNTPSS